MFKYYYNWLIFWKNGVDMRIIFYIFMNTLRSSGYLMFKGRKVEWKEWYVFVIFGEKI